MKVRLFALAALTLAMACESARRPTEISAPTDPSKAITDGAHGGNPDFFWLPPLVPNPVNDQNFDQGKFNSTLQPSLTVEICELQGAPVDAQGLPTIATDCIAGDPVKKFPAGTIRLQNPPDGFYQVLWNTRESGLDVTKFYRIKALVAGSDIPFGVADVDPVSNMRELRNARTGEVIPLNDGSTLPINFRIEKGGGPTLCGGASLCVSATVTNSDPSGFQVVTVDGGAGAIAGASFPNGWLPLTGPQSVVVTISQVDVGTTDLTAGTESAPCHPTLPLMQFPGCFHFQTTPVLVPIDPETGRQFATPVRVAVCFVLFGTPDTREQFAEMWASGPNEPPHALPDAPDAGILSASTRNCSTAPVIGMENSNRFTRFASAGWRKVKSGFGALFGVKTAYGVDLGLGGTLDGFTNVGPAVTANIEAISPTAVTLVGGGTVTPFVRLLGSNHHDGLNENTVGLAGIPVTFTVTSGAATLSPQGETGGTATQLVAITNSTPINPDQPAGGGGYAAVNWQIPSTPATYTLTADGQVRGGPVTFTVTVPAVPALSTIQGVWQNENTVNPNLASLNIFVDGNSVGVQAFGACVPTNCDWGVAPANTDDWLAKQSLGVFWDQGFATRTMLIEYISATRLKVTTFTHFVPPDPRTDYTTVEFFQRPV